VLVARPQTNVPRVPSLEAFQRRPGDSWPRQRWPASETLVWGFQSQALISGIFFSSSEFLGSIWKPVSSSRPIVPRAIARSGCQDGRRAYGAGYSVVARPCLDSREHDGMLVQVGMTITRGARYGTRKLRAATLYSVGPQDPDHDAHMRIGGEAPRRQAHSAQRHESQGFGGSPPPRIVIGDPQRSRG
jgi:hypothetical protein